MKKVLFPIMLVLILSGTVGLYYLVFDSLGLEIGHLFYINTITACVAEALLLSNIPIWSGEKMITVTNVTISRCISLYAVALFAWSLLFTLFVAGSGYENYRIYYIGLLILSLIFVAVCGISAIGAGTAESIHKEQEAKMENKQNLVQFVHATHLDIEASLERVNSEWKDDFLRLYKLALDKLATLPNEKLHKNPSIAQKVENDLTDISTMCEGLATSANPEEMQIDITNRVNRLIKYITTIKTL